MGGTVMKTWIMRTRIRVALSMFLVLQALVWTAVMVNAVQASVPTIAPAVGSSVTYAGVARLPAIGPWRFLDDGSHVKVGYTSIVCDSRTGALTVNYLPVQNVASVWVSPDETLSRRGIIAGASVGLAHTRILFTRLTADGPKPLSCASSVLRGDSANLWIGLVSQPLP